MKSSTGWCAGEVAVVGEPELLARPGHRCPPVTDQVVVRHERPRVAARDALGLEGRVDPGRHVGGLALAAERPVHVGEVRRVARAHHLGRVPQHRQAGQLGAELGGHPLPQVVDPVGAGVLEQDLRVTQLVDQLELVAQPDPQLLLDLGGDVLLGDLAGVGARVDGADRDRVEQPLVELRHPQRLVVAARVALVGLHLGLRDVEAEPLEGAGDAAGAAASRPRDDDELDLMISHGSGYPPREYCGCDSLAPRPPTLGTWESRSDVSQAPIGGLTTDAPARG